MRIVFHLKYHKLRPAIVALLGCAFALNTQSAPEALHTLTGHVPKTIVKSSKTPMADTDHLKLAIGLPLRDQAGLTAFLRELSDPAGAQYHKYLTPAEFTARFGPTEADYESVREYMEQNGLSVSHTHANRLILDVEGSVSSVRKAFHVNLNVFQHPTEPRMFYAPDTEPTVNASLPIQHIAGLNNYRRPKPMLILPANSNHANTYTGTGPYGEFMGRDFRNAYAPGVTLNGAGQTVALVEFDSFYPSDIVSYETNANLPPIPVVRVPIDGYDDSTPGYFDDEVALDIEMAISMAPGLSKILDYEGDGESPADNNDLLNQIALDNAAKQISCSWGYEIDATTDAIFQEMGAQGQSFFDACGDSGAFNSNPDAESADPYITIVGGTTLSTTTNDLEWISETVWQGATNGFGLNVAGSGGISGTYPIPYWQQSVDMSSNLGSTIWRNVPDVAMVADNIYVAYGNGQSGYFGGTSCAAPLWAGFMALVNQQAAQYGRPPAGFLNPALYSLAQSSGYTNYFHDVVTGDNTNASGLDMYYAVPGYDLCTGWGTPTGQALIDALAPPDSLFFEPGAGVRFSFYSQAGFIPGSNTVVLTNTQSSVLSWAIAGMPGWLDASLFSGIITNGAAQSVTFSLSSSATNFAPGNYTTNVVISNYTSGITHMFPVSLQVLDPLVVSLTNTFVIRGPSGGPLTLTQPSFTLSNASPVGTLSWTAQTVSPYISLTPAAGTLAVGAVTNVTVLPTLAAGNLVINAKTGTIGFANTTLGTTQHQAFTVSVGNGDFETGDLTDWTFTGDTNYSYIVDTAALWGNSIFAGEFAFAFGEVTTNLAAISQTFPTTPGGLYEISFELDNPNAAPTNEFIVTWNGYTLFNQVDMEAFWWTNMVYDVYSSGTNATLAFAGVNPPGDFGLDNITVTPLFTPPPPPRFTAFTVDSQFVRFQWGATAGATYQLQSTTNLPGGWNYFGGPIVATNSVMTLSEPVPASPACFYRLVMAGQ